MAYEVLWTYDLCHSHENPTLSYSRFWDLSDALNEKSSAGVKKHATNDCVAMNGDDETDHQIRASLAEVRICGECVLTSYCEYDIDPRQHRYCIAA